MFTLTDRRMNTITVCLDDRKLLQESNLSVGQQCKALITFYIAI